MHNNLYLPKGCTHHTPLVLLWLAPSHKTLRFKLNILNLTLGGISILHKTKYPIASGGHSPPDPLLQRSTTVISPPLSEILDPPLSPHCSSAMDYESHVVETPYTYG